MATCMCPGTVRVACLFALALFCMNVRADGFPVSLDEYLPQMRAPSHVYMQPDGSALVPVGQPDGVQLSLHRLDRDPSTPSYRNRRIGRVPSVLGSFGQPDGSSFWAHRWIPSTNFVPPPVDFQASFWRMDASGRVLQTGGAIAPFGARVFELNTGFYAISSSAITQLGSSAKTGYALCADTQGLPIQGCSFSGVAAANAGFWAVRRLLVAPGLYRFEALRFSVRGQLLETQPIPGSYGIPTFVEFSRLSNLLRFAVTAGAISVFNIDDSSSWQIVAAGTITVPEQPRVFPVGAGDWLLSSFGTVAQYTPLPFDQLPAALSARYSSPCANCTYVQSTPQGEVLVGSKSAGGYFKWLSRDGSQKLERQGVYDAYFASDNGVLLLAPDDSAARATVAHWFDANAQALITEAFSPALLTPLSTALFEGKQGQIIAIPDSRESAAVPVYTISPAGDRQYITETSLSLLSLPNNDSQPGSGYVHRQVFGPLSPGETTYESINTETGENFRVSITRECTEFTYRSSFVALGSGIYEFDNCYPAPVQIRYIHAGQVQALGQIPMSIASTFARRTNPAWAGGDEVRLLTQQQQGQENWFRVYGVNASGAVLRYQHIATENSTWRLLADGSLLIGQTVDGVMKARRVREGSVFEDYPVCSTNWLDDISGGVWSAETSVGTVCHTTRLGLLSQRLRELPFGGTLASNGDLISRDTSGRCVRLHAKEGQIYARSFGLDTLCFASDQIIIGEDLYRSQRLSITAWSDAPAATVLSKMPLVSVAEVADTFLEHGFE